MVFGVAELIACSRSPHPGARRRHLHGHPARRRRGPQAALFLEPGDRVRVEIDGLGVLDNPVR